MYTPIKKLGQNFLMDYHIVNRMVNALELGNRETVVEIGPGLGVLTDILVKSLNMSNSRVYAVEIDDRFVAKLEQMFVSELNVDIIERDILKWLPEFKPHGEYKILGSLPYYITSPIIHSIIKTNKQPELCVLLVQREVAEKVCSEVPNTSYLSSFVQTFYKTEYLGSVPKVSFRPKPKVDGGIVRMRKKPVEMDLYQIEKYEDFLHRAYRHPRKMLNKVFSKEKLTSMGLDPKSRPQNISPSQWLEAFYETQN